MKLNKQGFTVVELLSSFVLIMIIVVFLFEIVLELKNVYINETIKTEAINKNASVATAIYKMLEEENITSVGCSGNTCTINFPLVSKNISIINERTIKVGSQNFTYPEKTNIENINLLVETVSTETTPTGHNSYIKIEYSIASEELNKPIVFNFVYTYQI